MTTLLPCSAPVLAALPILLGLPAVTWVPLVAAILLLAVLLAFAKVPYSYNVNNLVTRWRTTVLTAGAFVLVVSLLTVMLAFVNGMQALTEGSGQPGNVVILGAGSTDESFSNLPISDVGDIENQPLVVREEGRPLVSRETFLVVNQPIADPPPGRPRRRFLQLRGLDDPALTGRVHGLELHDGGKWFSEAGVEQIPGEPADAPAAVQCVIGEGIAREFARDRREPGRNPDRLEPGDTFRLADRAWLVTGVLRSGGSTFDSEVWAKRALVGPVFGKTTYSSLVARTAGPQEAVRFKEFLNNDYAKTAVSAQVETEYFAGLSETNRQFLVAIVFVTAVMAVGGVFGVMNTMFAAISQRTKDIGVLRLLGYRRRQILVSFLTESLLIALVGGAVGCLLGSVADGWTASSIVSSGQGGGKFVVLKLVVDAPTIALGMLLSLGMGFLGGLIPALNAMRLTALGALR